MGGGSLINSIVINTRIEKIKQLLKTERRIQSGAPNEACAKGLRQVYTLRSDSERGTRLSEKGVDAGTAIILQQLMDTTLCGVNGIERYDFKKNLDNDNKYIVNYISSDQLSQIIGRLSGVTGTIIKLYAQQIKRVIFWRNDNTLGIQLHNGEYICFDCNPEYYIGLEKIMYTGG